LQNPSRSILGSCAHGESNPAMRFCRLPPLCSAAPQVVAKSSSSIVSLHPSAFVSPLCTQHFSTGCHNRPIFCCNIVAADNGAVCGPVHARKLDGEWVRNIGSRLSTIDAFRGEYSGNRSGSYRSVIRLLHLTHICTGVSFSVHMASASPRSRGANYFRGRNGNSVRASAFASSRKVCSSTVPIFRMSRFVSNKRACERLATASRSSTLPRGK
jgi:hypothetical protein